MMFYFLRDSLKGEDGHLSEDGENLALEVGSTCLKGIYFSVTVCSFQISTLETAVRLSTSQLPRHSGFLDSPNASVWLQATEGDIDPNNPFVSSEVDRIEWEFRGVIEFLVHGFNVNYLFVGHAGLLEALIHRLTGVMLQPLRECEGAIVDYDYKEFTLVQELRRS